MENWMQKDVQDRLEKEVKCIRATADILDYVADVVLPADELETLSRGLANVLYKCANYVEALKELVEPKSHMVAIEDGTP